MVKELILQAVNHDPFSVNLHSSIVNIKHDDDMRPFILSLANLIDIDRHSCSLKNVLFKEYEPTLSANISLIKDLIEKSQNHFLSGVMSEYLWTKEHLRKDAHTAVNAYNELLYLNSNDIRIATKLIVSICRIISKCDALSFSTEDFSNKCFEIIESQKVKKAFYSMYILKGLYSCNMDKIRIESEFLKLIYYFRSTHDYRMAIEYRKTLLELFGSFYRNNTDLIQKYNTELAFDYEALAKSEDWTIPSNYIRIIDNMQNAMTYWQKVKSPISLENRNRIAKEIEPIKESLAKSMCHISIKGIDLAEYERKIKTCIEKYSFFQVLKFITSFIPLTSIEDQTKRTQEEKENLSSLSDLFPIVVINNEGRKQYTVPIPKDEKSRENYAAHHAKMYYNFTMSSVFDVVFNAAKQKYTFDEDSLRFITEDNWFIPHNRKTSFLKGIIAGFDEDWSTAMHILMPQVENAIRCLAQECGAVVYRTNEQGVEECLSLTNVLSNKELAECLEEDLIFTMKVFFSSEYGFGMRNQISHGLLSDEELNSYSAKSVWLFVLKLCCMGKNIYEEKASRND